MQIQNYEFDQNGLPIVGATAIVYTATTTHPPVTIETSGVTDGNGKWSFTGLSEGSKDVKVFANGQVKWYKGKNQHGVGAIWFETPPVFLQVATPSAPGAGVSIPYFKADGSLYYRSGAGAETKVADYAGATGVLRAAGWGTVQSADIGTGQVTSTNILDGTILNADVNTNAAIAVSKLAPGTAATNQVLVSNGTTDSFTSSPTFDGSTTTKGGLNVGTATGAATGEVRASSKVYPGGQTTSSFNAIGVNASLAVNGDLGQTPTAPQGLILVQNLSTAQGRLVYGQGNGVVVDIGGTTGFTIGSDPGAGAGTIALFAFGGILFIRNRTGSILSVIALEIGL